MAPRIIVPLRRELNTDPEELRTDIHEFLTDIGVTIVWAAHAELVYMTLYELAINALTHGCAQGLSLASGDGIVTLCDDGNEFGLMELRVGGRGGNLVLSHLEAVAAGSLSVRYQRTGDLNEWSLVDELLALGANTPCGLAITRHRAEAFEKARTDLVALSDCDEIHLYPPALWSVSDWFMLARQITDVLGNRTLVIHGIDRSSAARPFIAKVFPDARFPD